ncbi:MAG: type II secretion system GspH family protein [Patescibacteria group bacterium]|nr:type II secretion system GspH family protein [Patescibacteria group bacterium]MCL5261689.1 type II secretion system GspH family protein [Patescibacteria group bacterium]
MKKGFTLVELLIVIAILAVLSTATLVVLNPAEMLAQARDTQRVTDLETLKNTVGIYIANSDSPDLDGAVVGCSDAAAAASKGLSNVAVTTGSFAKSIAAGLVDADRTVDGTGWVPINFAGLAGGSPIPSLPIDPTNSTDYVYRYACSNTDLTFEFDAKFQSTKYLTTLDYDGKDGGDQATFYEVGTSLTR